MARCRLLRAAPRKSASRAATVAGSCRSCSRKVTATDMGTPLGGREDRRWTGRETFAGRAIVESLTALAMACGPGKGTESWPGLPRTAVGIKYCWKRRPGSQGLWYPCSDLGCLTDWLGWRRLGMARSRAV